MKYEFHKYYQENANSCLLPISSELIAKGRRLLPFASVQQSCFVGDKSRVHSATELS